jgi:hypothetical protein
MEYFRGWIVNLVELYFVIKDADSVSDALIDWAQKVKQERKLKLVLQTMHQWLLGHEDWQDTDKSLRRLGHLIVRLGYEFDEAFRARVKDHLACRLGRVTFPKRTFDEEMLLRFYERFRSIQTGYPDCALCQSRARQQRKLASRKVDLHSPTQRQRFSSNPGYLMQAERVEEAVASQETVPRCRWCERLGDTAIMLHSPERSTLVTADRAFEAFGQILHREIRRLPSLAELKRRGQQAASNDIN